MYIYICMSQVKLPPTTIFDCHGLCQGRSTWHLNWFMSGWGCFRFDPSLRFWAPWLQYVAMCAEIYPWKGKKWCDQVIAGCSTNCSFTIFPFHIFTNQNKMFVAYSVSVDGLYLSNLRLVLNEILRCKPGSTVLMAPDCRSLSRMPLCWKRLLPMVYNLHFTASGHVDGIVDEVKLIVKSWSMMFSCILVNNDPNHCLHGHHRLMLPKNIAVEYTLLDRLGRAIRVDAPTCLHSAIKGTYL